MSLFEFPEKASLISSFYELEVSRIKAEANEGSDTNSAFRSIGPEPSAGISDAAFNSANPFVPAAMIALREAYDFLSANERMSGPLTGGRGGFYQQAALELSLDSQRILNFAATMDTLHRFGGGR